MPTFALAEELQADQQDYENNDSDIMSMAEYLDRCKQDPLTYATPHKRMLNAIGTPKMIDTRLDRQLSRLFSNKKIPQYPGLDEFYGMESGLQEIYQFFKKAAQGLEERKQVLYLVGPVGSAKSSVAERLKELMEKQAIYTVAVKRLKIDDETGEPIKNEKTGEQEFELEFSPINEIPLGLFMASAEKRKKWTKILGEQYGIPKSHLITFPSPWAVERMKEFKGDLNQFVVVKRMPSILKQIAIAKVEPGDENNQNTSALVGEVDLNKLEAYSQNNPDAYSFTGALSLANQGLFEFVEIFKAPPKVLLPLLTATQENNYKGTKGFGAIPHSSIMLAHSNMAEFTAFKGNVKNEAYMARIKVVKVPYTLRLTEELKIYEKLIRNSDLAEAHVAPGTLEIPARLAIMTRMQPPENGSLYSKMEIYDGKNLKDTDPKAKSYVDYQRIAQEADIEEGMFGIDTRWNFQSIADVFNFGSREDHDAEPEANPVHMLYVLRERIERESKYSLETKKEYLNILDTDLTPKVAEEIGNAIKTAYLTSSDDYGQNIFDRYVEMADHWIRDEELRDATTNTLYERADLEREMAKLEKPTGIVNVKDFRQELVNFCLRYRAENKNNNPSWKSHEKMRRVIEGTVGKNMDELLPVISFNAKASAKQQEAHHEFVANMVKAGYAAKQVPILVGFYNAYKKGHGPV